MFTFMAATLVIAATPDPAHAELRRLEDRWGQAFVTRDFDFIERIVAPEYRLVSPMKRGNMR